MNNSNALNLKNKQVGGSFNQPDSIPGIPRRRYLDTDLYQKEIDYVFRKSWLQVAHTSELEKEGSYLALDLPIGPVLIVRGEENSYRAFLNACAHRGARVVRKDSGCSRLLVCQFHSWSYDWEGKLVNVPCKEKFPGLDTEQHALESLRCELWGRFIYINFDQAAPTLMEWLTPMVNDVAYMGEELPLRVVEKKTVEVNCNWKLFMEAFLETYHVNTVHPKTGAPGIKSFESYYDLFANGGIQNIPYALAVEDLEWKGMSSGEAASENSSGDADATQGVFSDHIHTYLFFPQMVAPFQATGFPRMNIWPVDAKNSRVQLTWYGQDWGEGPRPEIWDGVIADFDLLLEEDMLNLESIQASVEASPDRTVPVSIQECLIYQLHNFIDKCIGAENIPQQLRIESDALKQYVIE